jgi:hypothetical protein
MKKFFYLLLIPILALMISSCDTGTDPDPDPGQTGNLIVQSTPVGAQIWINNQNRGTTPDTIRNLPVGNLNVTLRLDGYRDTTVSATIQTTPPNTILNVVLTSAIDTAVFGPVRIWETTGTTAAQPSGLVLKSGQAVTSADPTTDLLYFSSGNTFEIRSATSRTTRFFPGTSSNIFDGQDSPLAQTSWATAIPDRDQSKYYFLFDADTHYSKFRIVNFGGGTAGNPAWVEVEWIYNKRANDNKF